MTDPHNQPLPQPPQQQGGTPSTQALDIENVQPRDQGKQTKTMPMTLDPNTELASKSVLPVNEVKEQVIPEIPVFNTSASAPKKTTALDSLQPENMVQTPNGPAQANITPEIPVAQSGKPPTLANSATDKVTTIINRLDLKHPLPKIVALGLTIQSLFGMYRSVNLILVEIPNLEAQLQSGLVEQATINMIATTAAVTAATTILGLFFAIKLTFLQTKTAQSLSVIIGSMIFIGNAVIQEYLTHFNLADQWSEYSLLIIEYLRSGISNLQQ